MRAFAITALVLGACATAPSKTGGAMHPIVQTGDPVLRQRARELRPEELGSPELRALVARMTEAMRAAPGVGLAAPQLGVSLRVFVIEDPEALQASLTPQEKQERERVVVPLRVFINPTVTPVGDARATFFEGCLSVAGFSALVTRHHEVEVQALDEAGTPFTLRLQGWPARIVQHELDHLDGTLYVDRMRPRTFGTIPQVKARFAGQPIARILEALGESP